MTQTLFSSVLTGFRTLLFDSSCIGCGQTTELLCKSCEIKLAISPQLIPGEEFDIYSGMTYSEITAQIVLKAKEDGNRFARQVLTNSIVESLTLLLENQREISEITLVPIPSTSRSVRRRGGEFLLPIIKDAIAILERRRSEVGFSYDKLLRIRRSVKDQSKLTALERSENLNFAFEFTGRLPNQPIVVIDDVVTTGSTLREAFRALQERNLTVIAAVTACASGRRMRIR